jgi:DNA helicase IV
VLDATDAKGLEFDHVVVAEPSRLVTPDRAGLRLLYVTITRATKSLTIVHADALPEGLRP